MKNNKYLLDGNKCCLCGIKIAQKYNLKRHYRTKHKDVLLKDMYQKKCNMTGYITDRSDYTDIIARIIAMTRTPFTFWDNPDVRKCFRPYAELFNVPCSSKSMRSLIHPYATELKNKIGTELMTRVFSMKFDIATRKERNILGINVQFIDDNWQMAIRCLGMKEIDGRSTAQNLLDIIKKTLKEYKLKSQRILAITTDCGGNVLRTSRDVLSLSQDFHNVVGGQIIDLVESYNCEDFDDDMVPDIMDSQELSPIVQAAKLLNIESRCGAHVIQLAVGDFLKLKGRKEFIASLRTITKKARNRLRKLPANSRLRLPSLSNETRWSSSYQMVRKQYSFPIYN